MKGGILLIDDEADIRRLMARVLAPLKIKIYEAENGAEGLIQVAGHEISLIVLDYSMPVLDGLAFLKKLRGELQSEIPVLMMSGAHDPLLRKNCYALGAYDFIGKPENSDILLARVANGLKIAELLEYRHATERDLRISAAIMTKLAVPAEIATPHFRLETICKSYAEVGGDLCLAFGVDTEKPVFVIADISGHGVSAALFSVFVGVALRRAYREALTPHRILTRLNRELFEYLPKNYFVTMFCWSFDAVRRELTWANAGHPAPFIMASGRSRELGAATFPALGVRANQEYTAETLPFKAGDGLIAYTDGVLDAFRDEQYTIDKTMSQFFEQSANPRDFFFRMRDYLEKQTGFIDDRSIMVFSSGT